MKKILLFLLLIPSFISAQQIGFEAMFHNDGMFQGGISMTEIVKCFGIYFDGMCKENHEDDYFQTSESYTQISGFTTGLIYSLHEERLNSLSLGVGSERTELIDQKDTETNYEERRKFIVEAKASIYLCRSIEIVTGISSQPAIMAGVRVNIN